MDFGISMGGRGTLCPKCKNRLLPIRKDNVLELVCRCGYKEIPGKNNNFVKTDQIETR